MQLLIEKGCQYAARNNEGFTASDYAYSYVAVPLPIFTWLISASNRRFSTRDTLQDTARLQFENKKSTRRNVFAQAAARGYEWGSSPSTNMPPPPVPLKAREYPRLRSGSGTSRTTTTTSDSGELDSNSLAPGHQSQSSLSASSSPSRPSAGSNSYVHTHHSSNRHALHSSSGSASMATISAASSSTLTAPSVAPASALSPIANRMRERDLNAMEKYMRRNRSGSQGTSSTENKSQNGSSAVTLANEDDTTASRPSHLPMGGASTPWRLRPSMSAVQLRTTYASSSTVSSNDPAQPQTESRNRSGTNPTASRPSLSPLPLLTRSSSTSNSLKSMASADESLYEEPENYIGPPSQYARFPEPPSGVDDSSTPTVGRRRAFHLLSKPLPGLESPTGASHRRGMSATSVRGS